MFYRTKRLISFLIIVALIVVSAPVPFAGADESGLCFTAVNDQVLEISLMPVPVSGTNYLSSKVFKLLGISISYFSADNAAIFTYGNASLIFYMDPDAPRACEDINGNAVPLKAALVNGEVYVPWYTGRYFDMNHTYLSGSGYGDVIRIVDGSQYLSDKDFMTAAKGKIHSRYLEYYGNQPPGTNNPLPSESPEITDAQVYLTFIGLPTAEMLDLFKQYDAKAAFFITAEAAAEYPDIVRRIIGEGHSLGAYFNSSAEDELDETLSAIQSAAFYVPTLVSSAAEHSEQMAFLEKRGFVYYTPTGDVPLDGSSYSEVISRLPRYNADTDICILSNSDTQQILKPVLEYITGSGYISSALLETAC